VHGYQRGLFATIDNNQAGLAGLLTTLATRATLDPEHSAGQSLGQVYYRG
jgi:hypothetical protein